MALKKKLTKAEYEALPEVLKAEYTAKDDNYFLDVEGGDDTGELRRAKEREAQQRKEAQAENKRLKEELAAYNEKEAERERNKARTDKDVETLEKSWKSKLEASEAASKAEKEKLIKTITNSALNSAAAELANKLNPNATKMFLPHIKARMDVEIVDGAPVVKYKDKNGEISALTAADVEKEFRASADFKDFVVGSKARGGGAPAHKGQPGNGVDQNGKPKRFSELTTDEAVARLEALEQDDNFDIEN